MDILGYIASFVMGTILGLLGGGGSILTVPIMVYLFGLSPTVSTGYSLFIVGVTAFIGSIMYVRKGYVDFKTGLIFAVPSVIGVNVSRGYIIPQIPVSFSLGEMVLTKEIIVMATFSILMVLASYSMIKNRGDLKPRDIHPMKRIVMISVEGLVVGLIAGFVGAGGGFLIIPALVFFAGLSMRVSVGTSLMIIAVQSLLGFAGDVSRGISIEWTFLLTVGLVAALGIVFGFAMGHEIKEQKLKKAFGWFVLFMGATILLEQIRHLYLS